MNRLITIAAVVGALLLAALLAVRVQRAPTASAGPGAMRIAVYDEQVKAAMAVDEALILYRESPPLGTPGLEALTAVTVDAEDRIYAGGGTHLVVLTPQGDPFRRMTLAGDISCLAADAQGTVYVGLGNAVEAYDAAGRQLASFGPIPPDAIITSLAATGDDVFAADAQHRTVMRFSPDGSLKQHITGRGPDGSAAEFVIPSPYFDIVPGQGRTLWIVNPGMLQLEEYTFEGERIQAWQRESGMAVDQFCGCCNPSHVARLSDGSIVTSEKGLSRVKLYSRRGAFIGVVAPPTAFDSQSISLDLAVDSQDRILVTDPVRMQIRIFERK